MIEDLIEKIGKKAVFLLFWFLLYIICGFEVTVIGILLFILAEMRN